MNRFGRIIAVLLLVLAGSMARAQDNSFLIPKPHPAAKAEVRYEIDAKRSGVSFTGNEALPRSREFKRLDASYYVGWLYEGGYKHEHAADYIGFKNAIEPLEKSLNLLERDYRKALATRTKDVMEYLGVATFQQDYSIIAYLLWTCYNNIGDYQKSYNLMQRTRKWNFQQNYALDPYTSLAWITHVNRFYTSKKFPFLRNSIDENERLSNAYLDSALRRISINRWFNEGLLRPSYAEQERLGVYHYKAILYSYAFNIDSTNYYYKKMEDGGTMSHNNFATWQAIIGNFGKAYEEYTAASMTDYGDSKQLREWAYYMSILDIYKAKPKTGIDFMKEWIKAVGSTPGYGWYNIALARNLLYDGQVSESERIINKAAEFKELHIGTTLGETHYNFSIQLQKLMAREARWEMQKFENRNWWYNPRVLGNMGSILSELYAQQFLIINQLSQNPERERVTYKLFASESTVSWDEIWYLIRDFSSNFFLDKFRKEARETNRVKIRKYYQLLIARLYMKKDNYDDARKLLNEILNDRNIEPENEKLFTFRVYQALAECAKEKKDNAAFSSWMYKMYVLYPQLVPFTGLEMNMNLHVVGTEDKAVTDRLRKCNINWGYGPNAPEAYIVFSSTPGKKRIEYYVLDKGGNYVVPRQVCFYKDPGQTGIDMAYRIFGVGGKNVEKN